jgi:hypothetical protein
MKIWRSDPRLHTLAMSYERAIAVWSAMYERVLERHCRQGDWLFVHYDQVLQPSGVERIANFVGCSVDASHPERGLGKSAGGRRVPESARRIYRRLCERAGFEDGNR